MTPQNDKTEAEIQTALDELRWVQFIDNTVSEGDEARKEVEAIIRALAERLTK